MPDAFQEEQEMHAKSTVFAMLACVSVSACQTTPFQPAPPNKWDGQYRGSTEATNMGGFSCSVSNPKIALSIVDNKFTMNFNKIPTVINIDNNGTLAGNSSILDISGQITGDKMEIKTIGENCLFRSHLTYFGANRRPYTPTTTSSQGAPEKLIALKDLLDRNLISQAEYDTKRAAILNGM